MRRRRACFPSWPESPPSWRCDSGFPRRSARAANKTALRFFAFVQQKCDLTGRKRLGHKDAKLCGQGIRGVTVGVGWVSSAISFHCAHSCGKRLHRLKSEGGPMNRLKSWGVLALVLVFSIGVAAQTFRGTILGTVTDKSGGAVPKAKVTVRNVDTGLTRETQTTDDRGYTVPELPIGNYTVTVEKAGFQTSVTAGVRVHVGAFERRVDVVLQAGNVAQRIEVSGETLPLVETTSNVLGG